MIALISADMKKIRRKYFPLRLCALAGDYLFFFASRPFEDSLETRRKSGEKAVFFLLRWSIKKSSARGAGKMKAILPASSVSLFVRFSGSFFISFFDVHYLTKVAKVAILVT